MLVTIQQNDENFQIDLAQPLDISIPLKEGAETVNCFYAPFLETAPVIAGDFIGSTKQGGIVNFLNVRLNPHGNGTHTECVGHIARETYTINQSLKQFHFLAYLTSIYPQKMENGDRVISLEQLQLALENVDLPEAIIIRTLPNESSKCQRNYSGTNPPYFDWKAINYLVENGVTHLLVDLPSVDREEDDGKLLAHKAFWNYPEKPRTEATITELIYVSEDIKDGLYFLNLQIASFEIDVSPSKPILYQIKK